MQLVWDLALIAPILHQLTMELELSAFQDYTLTLPLRKRSGMDIHKEPSIMILMAPSQV
jgi:hypothetical protein